MQLNRRSAWTFGALVLACCVAMRVSAQDDQNKMPDMAAMMKKWMATVKPGPQHKMLEDLVGSWNVTVKMTGMGGAPVVTKGTSEITSLMDGRFIQENMTGEFMMPDAATGQMKAVPYKSQNTIGYDNYRHMFVGSVINNLSTAMLTCSGAKDPQSNTLTMYGQMDEPKLDVIGRTVKYVLTIKDKDHTTLSIYDLHAGENYKVLEYEYERKK